MTLFARRVTLFAAIVWAWAHHVQGQTFTETFQLDLLFLIDGSRTVGEANFRLLLQAVLNLTETLPVGENNVRVGAVTYSTGIRVMNLTGNQTWLEETIPDLFYEGRDAHTHFALEEARTVMMTSWSLRPAVPKVVILITDSSSRYPSETRRTAARLRALSVDVWAIGIGPYVRLLELIDITADLTKVRLTNRFDVLPNIDLSIYDVVPPVSTTVIVTTIATEGTTLISATTATRDGTGIDNSIIATSAVTTIKTVTTIESTQIQVITKSTATQTDGLSTASITTTRTDGMPTASITTTRTDGMPTASITSTRTDGMPTASITAARTDRMPSITVTRTGVLPTASITSTRTDGMPTASITSTRTDGMPSITTTRTGVLPTASITSPRTDGMPTASIISTRTGVIPTASITSTRTDGMPTASITATRTIPTDPTPTKTTGVIPELQSSMTSTKSAGVVSTESLTMTTPLSTTAIPSTNLLITPTSTEMTSSSPISVSSSRNVNDTDGSGPIDTEGRLGDQSVVFGPSDGVCSQAVAKEGFGYAPHPQDCDKFFQCHLSETGNVIASVRLCTRGLYWDMDKMACVEPELSCCRDRCKHRVDSHTYKMEGGCGLYWECQRGISWAMQCQPYHAYIPGKGCTFLPVCPYVDLSSSFCPGYGKCESVSMAEGQGYTVPVTGGVIMSRCPRLTQFSVASCSCRSSLQVVRNCPWVTILDPGQPSESGISDRKTMGTSSGQLAGKYDVIRSLTINFLYKRLSDRSRHEVLLRSRTCHHGGIFIVSEDFYSLHVRVLSPVGHTVIASVPLWGYNETEWRTVNIQYSEGNLLIELSEGHLRYTNYIQDDLPIPIGGCGWDVGTPGDLMNQLQTFTGNMTKISISYCDVREV